MSGREANRPTPRGGAGAQKSIKDDIKDAADVKKTSAQRIRDDRAAGKGAVRSTAKEAAIKGAGAVGIPPQVTRVVLNNRKVKVALISVAVLGPVLPILVILIALFGGAVTANIDDGGLDTHDDVEVYIPEDVLYEYQIAAAEYDDLPWTILAATGTLATEHGKLSPYPDDLCDRDPDREALRTTTATEEGCDGRQTSVHDIVEPGIGTGTNQGRGPLLISPRAVRVADFDPQVNTAVSSAGEDPQSSIDWIAFELNRIRTQMVEEEGWVFDPEDETKVTEFWTEAVRRLAIIDPQTAACPASFLASTPGEETARAVSQMWRCELARANENMVVLDGITINDDGEYTDELAGGEAIDALTTEGLTVAYAWSGYGARNSDQILCKPPPDNPETEANEAAGWAPAPLAGVFPLTEAVFNAYADQNDTASGMTRCDATANIRAAVRALIAGESTAPGEREGPARSIGDRSAETGPWNPVLGGWWAMPWALGTGDDLASFLEDGPKRPYAPRAECFEAIDQWLVSTAPTATVFRDFSRNVAALEAASGAPATADQLDDAAAATPGLDAALAGWPRELDVCGPAPDGDWERAVAALATSRAQMLRTPDGEATRDAEDAPPADLAAAADSTDDTVDDGAVTLSLSAPLQATTTTPAPTTTTVPVPTTGLGPVVPTTIAPELLAEAANLDGMAAWLKHRASGTGEDSTIPAVPGTDMMPLRLSPTGRTPEGLPPEPDDPRPSYSQRIITLAIGIGGLVEGDSRFDPDADPFGAAFASQMSGGGSIVGIPEPMATAFANAPAAARARYPNCDIQVTLVAAVSTVESKPWWGQIGPDGIANPWIIGIPLNGTNNTQAIRDSDGGRLDRDTVWDRAVGPMQFIPTTWAVSGLDGNGDGIADPQNVHDSAAAAAGYLCAGAGNLSLQTVEGKTKALLSYNRSTAYGLKVMQVEQELIAAQNAAPAGITLTGGGGAINVTQVRGITVAVHMAAQLERLLAAAERDGLYLTGGGFRTAESQISLRRQHCGSSHYAIYEMPSGQCTPPTARPGSSNHETGEAIDFRNCSTRSTACYQWLARNAAQFGYYNFPREPWHWSIDGN